MRSRKRYRKTKKIIICGDLNGHVGKGRQGSERINGDWGLGRGMKQGKRFWSLPKHTI